MIQLIGRLSRLMREFSASKEDALAGPIPPLASPLSSQPPWIPRRHGAHASVPLNTPRFFSHVLPPIELSNRLHR